MLKYLFKYFHVAAVIIAVTSCSTTANLPEGESLYIGLKPIVYEEQQHSEHFSATKDEVEAALQMAPNGALFGSSYYRTPFPYGLWIWNAFHDKENGFSKWITKSFGNQPVLMSNVNPVLRSQIAINILRNNGYFNGDVNYQIVETSNPKKQKIQYNVSMGKPCLVDTLVYTNFPENAKQLIVNDSAKALIKHGTPFTTNVLDAERNRVAKLLRDSGYYYYQPSYASYLADTLKRSGWADMQLQMADSIPEEAMKRWYIGHVTLDIKRQFTDELTDSTQRRHLKIRYNGNKVPVRPRVILSNMRMFPRRVYSYQQHSDAMTNLSTLGLFSNVDFQFSPRDNDSLDLNVLCVLDKPYDFYVQTNLVHKLSGRTGPELKVGLTKKNAFMGGEKFDVNLHSSFEWQEGSELTSSERNSYELGMDASVEWPRLLIPFLKKRRYAISPATKMTASFNIINRPGYYRMHTASGEWSYIWKPKEYITHHFSPLILTYQRKNYSTEKFDSILNTNSYLNVAMKDMFIPKMQYTYSYTTATRSTNPIVFSATLTESGNFTSLVNKLFFGQDWTESGKTMFKNAYSQFLKLETDFSKTWRMDENSQLVAHASLGAIWAYGNLDNAPYSEQFYIGGANSIRAFPARGLGPGSYHASEYGASYINQIGDVKLVLNLEYRKRLFDNLYGAVFLDAGNIWALREDDRVGERFILKNIPEEIALGTGIGIRYDMDFIVLRLDWGVGIHAPYGSNNKRFYNFGKFKDSHTLHFAVGYPF